MSTTYFGFETLGSSYLDSKVNDDVVAESTSAHTLMRVALGTHGGSEADSVD